MTKAWPEFTKGALVKQFSRFVITTFFLLSDQLK